MLALLSVLMNGTLSRHQEHKTEQGRTALAFCLSDWVFCDMGIRMWLAIRRKACGGPSMAGELHLTLRSSMDGSGAEGSKKGPTEPQKEADVSRSPSLGLNCLHSAEHNQCMGTALGVGPPALLPQHRGGDSEPQSSRGSADSQLSAL